MKVQSSSGRPVQTSGVDQPLPSENTKNTATSSEAKEAKQMKQPSQAESTSKKNEMKMAGEAQAAAIRWEMDEHGKKWQVLKFGSTGPKVKELQQKLNEDRERNGLPPIKVDGIYGKETQAAVKRTQYMSTTGIAGPKTQWYLGMNPRLDVGSKGSSVKEMQERLNSIRIAAGQSLIKADGIYGKETEEAVRDFQKNTGLKSDGIVGGKTLDKSAAVSEEMRAKEQAHTESAQAVEAEVETARAAESAAQAQKAYNEEMLRQLDNGRIASDGKK